MRDCLTCKRLVLVKGKRIWHECTWRITEPLPACLYNPIRLRAIDITCPFQNCPAWKEREAEGKR